MITNQVAVDYHANEKPTNAEILKKMRDIIGNVTDLHIITRCKNSSGEQQFIGKFSVRPHPTGQMLRNLTRIGI